MALDSTEKLPEVTIKDSSGAKPSSVFRSEAPLVHGSISTNVSLQRNKDEESLNTTPEQFARQIAPSRQKMVQHSIPRNACLFCYQKPGRRQIFRRKDILRKHYRLMHFQYQIGPFICPVPKCDKLIKDPDHFGNHAVSGHRSDLGVRASIMRTESRRARPGQLASFNL